MYEVDAPDHDTIRVARSDDAKRIGGMLRDFAVAEILSLLLESGGRPLTRQYVELTIMSEFKSRCWHVELDDVYDRSRKTYAQNCIHNARRILVQENLIQPSDPSSNADYVLLAGQDTANRVMTEIRDGTSDLTVSGDAEDARRKLERLEARESDAVYVIIDPARPNWCKVGAGIGDCRQRLREAKLWTRSEADIAFVVPVGRGNGKRVERAVHGRLGKEYEAQGEWFRCQPRSARDAINKILAEQKDPFVG